MLYQQYRKRRALLLAMLYKAGLQAPAKEYPILSPSADLQGQLFLMIQHVDALKKILKR